MSEKCCSVSQNQTHDHNHGNLFSFVVALISLGILFLGLYWEYIHFGWFLSHTAIPILWYGVPFLVMIIPMSREAYHLVSRGDFFNEVTLMLAAMLGALYIQKYAEALGVVVFYTIGEYVQDLAVSQAKKNIKALLDVRPKIAYVVHGKNIEAVNPEDVLVGSFIEVKTGERVPLDGTLITKDTFMNTSALTGESVPRMIKKGEIVLSGMMAEEVIRLQTTKRYNDSTFARILQMVQDASQRKSPTEQMIRRLARYYTPIVFALSMVVILLPAIVLGGNYEFQTWLYRGLVFLVISCPCAFVISVPLGFFGGIGLGSRNGILFKGGNFLHAISRLKLLLVDKTGTLTKGVFTVQHITTASLDQETLIRYCASLEQKSSHPIAKAVVRYALEQKIVLIDVENIKEFSGLGLLGTIQGKILLSGSAKLLQQHHVTIPQELLEVSETMVFNAYNGEFAGAFQISDEIKPDAINAVKALHKLGISVVMLSGDKLPVVEKTAHMLGISHFHGDLLPDEKMQWMQTYKAQNSEGHIAFMGDGINDAPGLAFSDIGIAMGGLGSDLAVESADVIIQNDEPSKVCLAIKIAQATNNIVYQNIMMALVAKIVFLILGAAGLAGLWEAVFADVGISFLATLNALRLQYFRL